MATNGFSRRQLINAGAVVGFAGALGIPKIGHSSSDGFFGARFARCGGCFCG
jgi:hypothetical protein